MTHDVTIHTAGESVTFRYEGPDEDHLHLIGVVTSSGAVAPVPAPRPLPPAQFDGQGVPLHPTVPATDTLFVAPTNQESQTQKHWQDVKDIPESHK